MPRARATWPVEAVANVILNRAAKKLQGQEHRRGRLSRPAAILLLERQRREPLQDHESCERANAVFDRCLKVATRAVKGEIPGPHGRRAALPRDEHRQAELGGGKSPNAKATLKIGRHIFYTGIADSARSVS